MSKIKIYENPSHSFDAQKVKDIVYQDSLDNTGNTNVLLYGNYTYNEDEKVGQFEKAFLFDNDQTSNNLVCIGDKSQVVRFTTLDWGEGEFFSNPNSYNSSHDWLPFQDATEYSDGQYFVLRNEVLHIHDLEMYVPLNFGKGFRQIHFCKSCNEHYKRRCKCLNKSRPSGHSPNQVYFCDVEKGFDVNSIKSLNHLTTNTKTFLGFEWELGFENPNLSTNEIAFALYRHIKNKDVNLFNLFGDNMRDGSIDNYYSKGSEIGSNVMSFDYYQKYATMIEEVSEFANSRDIFGSNLGFHINISRDSFVDENEILNFLVLTQTSVEILVKLSGRRDEGSNMNNYCPIDIPFGFRDEEVEKINRGLTSLAMNKKLASKIFNGNAIGDKMTWMAFHKNAMIEFRLPSSSTDNEGHAFSKTCRHLELVFAMVEYSRQHTIDKMRFDMFLDWIHENEHFVNIYNAIVCNDDIMELIEQATSFAKQLSIAKPNLEFDFDNDNTSEMENEFGLWMDKCKNAKEVDDSTKQIKDKYNKKVKDRKERKV
tara:strand:- start:4909 stop:6522 length:1614 start_codon:yes stop_codon:yes gene_type:complete